MTNATLLKMHKGEITEFKIYSNLAQKAGEKNKKILEHMARDELRHYNHLKNITGKELKPNRLKIWWYTLISSAFGLSFGLRLMERGERGAQSSYSELKKEHPKLAEVLKDEVRHEHDVLNMISEEKLEYASSIVLGLNDALVELSGTLAGLTFALSAPKLIALSGLIVGIASALSMSASSYLSKEEEGGSKNAKRAALYTGAAYIVTVLLMVAPYFIFRSVYVALAVLLAIAVAIIGAYTFYITVAKDQKFAPRFIQMAAISLGVAFISFVFGIILKQFIGA